ncbi:hypothetical protein KMI_10g16160 [Encephalitozoon hellem]|nr:hypothetical protein KMI_10g16160 [Encephalitozoon hellem]
MDVEIRRHMEGSCGDSMVGVQAFVSGESYIFLLFNREVLLAGVTLQRVGSHVYIKNVDTTGYERGHARKFITSILKALSPELSCCFSTPKSEYIFNGSSQNKGKVIREPGELLEYWIGIFEDLYDDLHVWSNHYENISYPFKHLDEVVYFEDDPKERLRKHFVGSLEEMFAVLLCRADFTNGSLVYGRLCKHVGCGMVEAEAGDVYGMEAMLRTLDFSTHSMALKSTEKFISRFGLDIEYFPSKRTARPKKSEQACIVLSPTRKV